MRAAQSDQNCISAGLSDLYICDLPASLNHVFHDDDARVLLILIPVPFDPVDHVADIFRTAEVSRDFDAALAAHTAAREPEAFPLRARLDLGCARLRFESAADRRALRILRRRSR